MATIQYVEIPGTSSSSHQICHIQQNSHLDHQEYQIVTLPPGQQFVFNSQTTSPQKDKGNGSLPNNCVEAHLEQVEPQVYQLISMSEDGIDQKEQPFIIQLPDSMQLSDLQAIQIVNPNGSNDGQSVTDLMDGGVPVQVLNLGDGTAFIPMENSSFFQLAGGSSSATLKVNGDEKSSMIDKTAIDVSALLNQRTDIEPVYVNEKQYARILKRRVARLKLEQEGRIPKERRKYLHESRHKHAQNRVRREGGKFDSGNNLHRTDADDESPSTSNANTPTPNHLNNRSITISPINSSNVSTSSEKYFCKSTASTPNKNMGS